MSSRLGTLMRGGAAVAIGLDIRSCLVVALMIFGAITAGPAYGANEGVNLDEVVVTGEHPGPGLWEVSNGERTLWILGTYAPLPKEMTWRSVQIEEIVASCDEVLAPYAAQFSVPGVDPQNLAGANLKAVLPRDLYSKWRKLQRRYVEKKARRDTLHPTSAALQLQLYAFDGADLTYGDKIWPTVQKLARTHDVPISDDHQLRLSIKADATNLAEAVFPRDLAIEFLRTTVARLEVDIAATERRAKAWAVGDVRSLRARVEQEQREAYYAALSGEFIRQHDLHTLFARADEKWLATAERALQRNSSTLAVVPVEKLLSRDGLLVALANRGYQVRVPE